MQRVTKESVNCRGQADWWSKPLLASVLVAKLGTIPAYPRQFTLSKLLRTTRCQPCVILTDKLRRYGAAQKIVLPPIAHRQSRYLNHRAENSPQPTRPRERRRKRFQSPEQAQRFLEIHDIVAAHFRPKRHLLSAAHCQNVTAPMQRLQL